MFRVGFKSRKEQAVVPHRAKSVTVSPDMNPTESSRRQFLRTVCGMGVSLLPSAAQTPQKRPNIIYIMSDDHAAHAISAYGSKINQTPNIDRIAKEGMKLANCFCTNSICTPSRACILTGQYSHINGVKTLADTLDPKRNHVAKMLRNAGYQTAMVGKWHLVSDPEGFDYWNILPGQGLYHNPVMIEMGKRTTLQGYATDLIADISLDFISKRDKSKPFFVMCHHKAPHRPWQPDAKHADMYKDKDIPEPDNLYDDYSNRSNAAKNATLRVGENFNRTDVKGDLPPLKGNEMRKWAYQVYMKDYLRCVASVDDNVGKILDYLDKENLAKDTIIIYTSDQGFFLGDHGWFDKRFIYEESLRMPFLVRYPGHIKPGSVRDEMVLNIDFAPTFLDFADVKADSGMQGVSARGILEGKKPKKWRETMYYRYWMHLADHGVAAHYGVRSKRYKLIYYYGEALGTKGSINKPTAPEWEFFDLQKDPREMRNAYEDKSYAKVIAGLKVELIKLRRQYGDNA